MLTYLYDLDGRIVAYVHIPLPLPDAVTYGGATYAWDGQRYTELPTPCGDVQRALAPSTPAPVAVEAAKADPTITAAQVATRSAAVQVCLLHNVFPGGWKAVECANAIAAMPLPNTAMSGAADLATVRDTLVAGCERIMSIRIGVSREAKQYAAACLAYWRQCPDDVLNFIAQHLSTFSEET